MLLSGTQTYAEFIWDIQEGFPIVWKRLSTGWGPNNANFALDPSKRIQTTPLQSAQTQPLFFGGIMISASGAQSLLEKSPLQTPPLHLLIYGVPREFPHCATMASLVGSMVTPSLNSSDRWMPTRPASDPKTRCIQEHNGVGKQISNIGSRQE